jgi:uncharacterized membrane protein
MIKKYIATIMMMAMVAVMVPMLATSAEAQTYRDQRRERNVYDKHRNLINIGIGTGAGALIGALVGGKKGAVIGAAAGAGGGALYTYVFNPKTKKYERRYRRNYDRNYDPYNDRVYRPRNY